MWVDFVPVVFALVGSCVAVFTDLRERIIPNRLTYPLIVVGIGFHLVVGFYRGEFVLAFFGVFGAGLAFSLGYFMYLTGGWAGGDVKLFTAFGALLPAYESPHVVSPLVAYPLFPITILINSVLAAIPVLLIYVLVSRLKGFGIFYETKKISELEEGIIPAEIIYQKNEEIERYDAGPLGFLSRKLSAPDWDEKLTDPDRAAGVTDENIEKLKQLVDEGKLEDRIKTKKGMPFGPALAAGLFIGVFYGSLYWKFMLFLI
ncbi:hypothetical protein AKJ50_00240 [candidate division MSBL1 archaeon SCGC-AAA382A13]|uniref:Prepilin type IV endopeptidase peptidase domain-containing protein n=1 Tax=candidate division MSBL1 archaeon SCGC-AAA382A13 TaxID=1698279 RepID=A0A133VGY5_9EURY|nr:hypothetical protein AKJ50_00240 [candidate division MSBL1 archaeon SCGC-AAA382A13]